MDVGGQERPTKVRRLVDGSASASCGDDRRRGGSLLKRKPVVQNDEVKLVRSE